VIEIEDRHRELLRILAGARVQFVLVGGVALQLRGFSGATRDLDITIAIDDLNTRRLDQALEALQAKPYLTSPHSRRSRASPLLSTALSLKVATRFTHNPG
jgi:hypothetical protein